MVLSSKSLEFDSKDVECIYESKGVQWILWFNKDKVFMVTATNKDGKEEYKNIFEDFDDLLAEAMFDDDIRNLVACIPDLIRSYQKEEDIDIQ